MGENIHVKESNKQAEKQVIKKSTNRTNGKSDWPLKIEVRQEVTKSRIERLKKTFKSQWLMEQIKLIDDNKGK